MPTNIWEPTLPQSDTASSTPAGRSDEPRNSETLARESGRNHDASTAAAGGVPAIEEINTHGSER